MLNFKYLMLIVFLFLGQSPGGLAAQDEDGDDKNHARIMKRIVGEVEKEIRFIYLNRFRFHAKEYSDHFELGESQKAELNKVVEEMATEMQKGHTSQQITNVLTRKIRKIEGLKVFSINGENFSIDESVDPAGETPGAVIQVSSAGDYLWLNTKSGGSSMNSRTRIDLISDKRWRKTLGEVTDEQMIEFKELSAKRHLSRVLDLVERILAVELMISDDQVQPLRDWLDSHEDIQTRKNASVYPQARVAILALKDELPDGFTPAQRKAFRKLKNQMTNR